MRARRRVVVVVVLSLVVTGIVVVVRPLARPARPPALRVLATWPRAGAANVGWATSIRVQLNEPLASAAQLPRLTPPVPGRWTWRSATTVVFRPRGFLSPGSSYEVVIPVAPRGAPPRARTTSLRFTVALPSVTRLQQLLAELGYLPVTFAPAGASAADALTSEPTVASAISPSPQLGAFGWRYRATPPELRTLFRAGYWSALDQGAVMTFEADHGLPVNGVPEADVWSALREAVAERQRDPRPFTYLVASEARPERLDVWRAGRVIVTTLVNTGAPGAATPLGTWPVRLRFLSATMRGTDPNGTRYVDPGVPDVAYFDGSLAVHGFPRAAYGFPQSNGCVEVPLAMAATVYRYDPIGTPVTVTSRALAS
ncbi:MAG: L,D-transpeptidase family protein [Acidimicrobiales bacterium]